MTIGASSWDAVPLSDDAPGFYARAYRQATHPRYALLYGLAMLWAGYFLWIQNWRLALATLVAGKIVALATVWRADVATWTDSSYGRLIRSHYHPMNLAFHLVGFAGFAYGLWQHESVWFLAGLTAAGIGHLWGWKPASTQPTKGALS